MKDKDIIYRLLRKHEYVIGSNKLSILSLDSLINSIKELKVKDTKQYMVQVEKLIEIINNSEPKIIPLIHLVEHFKGYLEKRIDRDKVSLKRLKALSIKYLDEKKDFFMDKMITTANIGKEYVKNKDIIIVHSVSSVVLNILIKAKKDGKEFKIMILEQDCEKTKQLIKAMERHKIEYEVVPEYSTNHIINNVSKIFIGAIALTTNNKIVSAIGTSNIISISHLNKIPSYLFINSLKFSHKDCKMQKIYTKKIKKEDEDGKYQFTSFSHDLIELKLIDKVITEDGEITKQRLDEYRKCK